MRLLLPHLELERFPCLKYKGRGDELSSSCQDEMWMKWAGSREQAADARVRRCAKGSLEQFPGVRRGDRFVTILHVQLAIDAVRLGPDGIDRDHELGRDFAIREASPKSPQAFPLPTP